MPNPLTQEEQQRILDLHAEGVSRNDIAREVGRSPGSVSNVVRAAGLTFERGEEVAAATRARQADNAEKRALLEERLLDEAHLLMDDLHKPHVVYNFGGRDNTYEEHQLAEPDVHAKATIIRAVKTATDSAIRLAQVDAASKGAAEGKSMLGSLADALRVAYDSLPSDEDDPDDDGDAE